LKGSWSSEAKQCQGMDQIVPVNPNKLDDKNFPGAIRIIRYFDETGINYARLARLFDPKNARSMIAVFRSDKWSAEDVKRWDRVIDRHEELKARIKERKSKSGTVMIKKEKEKKKLR